MLLEICTGSFRSALAACKGGADRIELCSGLDEGGLTPSAGLAAAVRYLDGVCKHALIRPRGGDFLYTDEEKEIIRADIAVMRNMGYDGIVTGALLPDGNVDKDFLMECRSEAGGMSLTFHRAFDLCADPFRALEDLIDCGCQRVLTSGQAATAEAGIPLLQQLVRQAAGRIAIMPGCGVNPSNAAFILAQTGANEIHASARSAFESRMAFRKDGVGMGKPGNDEYCIKETDERIVREIREKIDSL